MNRFKAAATTLAVATLISGAAYGQDAYVVGMSTALTGPAASTYAGAAEGLKLYIDRLNKAGGVNGKQVTLVVQDDQGQPSRAAANAKRLLTEDNVILLVNTSLSSTFAPMIAESQRAGVPLLFSGSVCPPEVFPPANEFLFCSTSFSAIHDSRATIDFIQTKSGTDVKLGLAAMAIPVSRGSIDEAEKMATAAGMKPVDKEIIPPGAADYTPFATKLQQAEPNWVFSWAPWVVEIRVLDSLRKLGWKGDYVVGHLPETEGEMIQLKDPKFYTVGANAMLFENLPIGKEIVETVKAAGSPNRADQVIDGWIGGLVIETALKAAGWPATPVKVKDAMSNIKIDTKGLRGGPIEWTKENHFRTTQYYRAYRWSDQKNAMEVNMDWKAYPIK